MRLNAERDDRVTQEAARWLGTLLHGPGKSPQFFSWLEESPRHVEEFLIVLADAQDIAALSAEQRARIEALSHELGSSANESNVVPFSSDATERAQVLSADDTPQLQRAPRVGTWAKLSLGIAASLLIAMGALWWLTGPGAWETYRTAVGEQRAVALPDGSVVHLNTDSAISVHITDSVRDVRLVRGEALFSVEHDPGRPFLVRTSNAVIQAIGTRFNVYSHADRTQVAVLEGLVQVSNSSAAPSPVSPPQETKESAGSVEFVAAGQATVVSPTGELTLPQAVDPVKAVAWRQRRLVFEDDELGEIATQFNRYNAAVKIRVIDPAASAARFSGTFDADAPEAMMQALVGDSTLRVERVGNEILISPRDHLE